MSKLNDKISEVIEILRDIRYDHAKENGLNWKSQFEWLINDIELQLNAAVGTYNDFKEQGLTFSTIEAEGYVRGIKTMLELVKYSYKSACDEENQ